MNNYNEARKRLWDAQDFLKSAQALYQQNFWRGCIQNAQGCVELSAKAIISLFDEPQWTHDPSEQLILVVEKFLSNIEIDEKAKITDLAQASKELAPWHGKTVYGEFVNNTWLSATELATEEKAKMALNLAQKCLQIAQDFLKKWKED